MTGSPNRMFHARFILAASERYALAQVRVAGERAPDRDKFVGWALPHAFFAVAGLRMALEYAAHDVQKRCLPGCTRESTFPLCDDLHSFESVMGSRFPGLKEGRRDIWEAFLRMQPFSHMGFDSLGVLNELWQHSKHIDLDGTMTHELVATFEDPKGGSSDTVRRYFLTYGEGKPLLELLQLAVKQVGAALTELEGLLGTPSPPTSGGPP
ncbi:MAG: hypothetical protein JRM77_09140 [Nitrososphaerota archaeon]|nr:hypothetical protein [Nitrososphaerota archaeon]